MMAHPLALQLRNLQSLVEIGVDKNTTVVFPAPLMSTITDLGVFLQREKRAAQDTTSDAARAGSTPQRHPDDRGTCGRCRRPRRSRPPLTWPRFG